MGAHSYVTPGRFLVHILIRDRGGSTASAWSIAGVTPYLFRAP